MNITVNAAAVAEASRKLSNWGSGQGRHERHAQLRHAQDIVEAGKLIKTGKVFALGIPLDRTGRRPDCSADASTRSTRCSQPAPMRSPASRLEQAALCDDTLMLACKVRRTGIRSPHLLRDKAYNGHNPKLIDSRA